MPDPGYVGPYSPEYYDQVIADQYRDDPYRPFWYDLGIEIVRRGAETAQIASAGWPSYPQIPQPPPTPQPYPQPSPGAQPPQDKDSVKLSNTTLMLLVGGVLLFMLGKRGR